MATKDNKQDAITEVFCALGLGTSEDRQRFRTLAHLGRVGEKPKPCRREPTGTRNNTAKEENGAQLEPTD